jgi:hypothetical protein
MVINESGEWVVDLINLTCRNTKNNIVIIFKNIEGNLVGKIKDLPLKIISEWVAEGKGKASIKNTVIEAEIIFVKAYLGNDRKK